MRPRLVVQEQNKSKSSCLHKTDYCCCTLPSEGSHELTVKLYTQASSHGRALYKSMSLRRLEQRLDILETRQLAEHIIYYFVPPKMGR